MGSQDRVLTRSLCYRPAKKSKVSCRQNKGLFTGDLFASDTTWTLLVQDWCGEFLVEGSPGKSRRSTQGGARRPGRREVELEDDEPVVVPVHRLLLSYEEEKLH